MLTRHCGNRRARLKRLDDNPPLERLRITPTLAFTMIRQE